MVEMEMEVDPKWMERRMYGNGNNRIKGLTSG